MLEDAARGAIVGGTVGGVHGAVTESQRQATSDAQKAQANETAQLSKQNAELEARNRELETEKRLLVQIGPDNTEAVRKLVQCDHQGAVLAARRSADSDNENFRTAGLWLEAVCAYDRRDLSTARGLYAKLAQVDPKAKTADDAELIVLDLTATLEDTRESFGKARRCN